MLLLYKVYYIHYILYVYVHNTVSEVWDDDTKYTIVLLLYHIQKSKIHNIII